jgi:hypothetical protein
MVQGVNETVTSSSVVGLYATALPIRVCQWYRDLP